MKQSSFVLLSIVCAGAFVTGCSTQAPTLMGTWKNEANTPTSLTLNPDQTFEFDFGSDSVPEIFGTYRLQGNEIVFESSATSGAEPLDPSPGRYTYQLKQDTVEFNRLEDPSNRRTQELAQPWEKVD